MGADGGRWVELAFFSRSIARQATGKKPVDHSPNHPQTTSKTCKKCKNHTENRLKTVKSVE
jgi:transposase